MSAHSHKHKHGKMKGVHTGTTAFSISVKEVPIPKIINRTDAIIRPTSAGICGSDLHILHGRIKITEPLTLGHEIIGIVEEIGDLVHDVKKGDRVLVTSLLSEETDDEISVDLGVLGYPFGTAFNGGQAELVRVHFASDNCLVLPPGTEHELDYVALSDIFCTANWALDAAGFQFTDVAVVFGAGT
jgi:threonine dehydrogenase-like Zn-dependent dehydrogenase